MDAVERPHRGRTRLPLDLPRGMRELSTSRPARDPPPGGADAGERLVDVEDPARRRPPRPRTARPPGGAASGSVRRARRRSIARRFPTDAQIERRRRRPRSATRSSDVDPRAPDGHLHLDPLAVQAVRALAVDLHRRRGRDRQLDLAAQSCRARASSSSPARGVVRSITSPSGSPVDVRARQIDLGDVALVETDEAAARVASRGPTTGRADLWRTGRASLHARSCARAPAHLGDDLRTTTARRACRRG